MAKHYGIDGVGTIVELGKGGPKVVNSAGTVDIKNNANNAYADVKAFKATLDTVQFATVPTVGDYAEGHLFYDATWKTLSAQIGRDVTLQIGQEDLRRVYNNTGSTIHNGEAVYATGVYSGGTNDVITVALAKADSTTTAFLLGCVTQDIANGEYGFVTVRGHVNDLDTNRIGSAYLSTQGLAMDCLVGGTAGNAFTFEVINTTTGGLTYTEVGGAIIVDLGGTTPTRAQLATLMTVTTPSAYVDVHVEVAGNVIVASVLPFAGGVVTAAGDVLYLSAAIPGKLRIGVPDAPNLEVRVGRLITKSATVGRINVNISQAYRLGDLTDVTSLLPAVDDTLKWNGSSWVNGPPVSSSASAGIEWWPDTTNIINKTTENDFVVETLGKLPVTSAESVEAIACTSNTVIGSAYLYDTALGRTTLEGGSWAFDVYCSVSSTSGGRISSATFNMYTVRPYTSSTVTITGSGTSRTCTASSGTPFAVTKIVASATNTLASFVQTPKGMYQITAITSDTEVTILTPTGYNNESTVGFSVWKKFGGVNTGTITALTTSYGLISKSFASGAVTVEVTDKLGMIVFGTSNNTTTVNYVYNGTANYSHVSSPLVTLHDNLAGLNAGNYRHFTATDYTDLTDGGTTTLHTHTIPVPTTITVAVEATDTSSFPLLVTASTGDLGPKTSSGWGLSTAHAYTGTGVATSGLPRMFLGTNAPSGDDSALLICRAIAGTDLFSHGVRDESTFTSLTTGAYASFDSIPVLNGNITYNHIASFQSRHQYAGGGTLTDSVGFSYALTTSGAVTASTAFRVYDYAGAGAVTNFYALYIPTLTKPTNHWTIYSTGTSKAYHAGNFGIGTTNPLSPLSVSGDTAAPTVFQDGNNGQVTISSPSGVGTVTKLTFSTPAYGGTGGNAGIGVKWTAGGTEMMFGTSNTYTGISNTALLISPGGLMGIGGVIDASSLLNVSRYLINSYGATSRVFCETSITSDNALYNRALEVDNTGTYIPASKIDSGYKAGVRVLATPSGSYFAGTQASMMGFMAYSGIGASVTSGAALTNAYGAYLINYNLTAGTTLTNSYGVYIDSRNSAVGTITNAWDIYAASATAYNYFAGSVGIGVAAPLYRLDLRDTTWTVASFCNTTASEYTNIILRTDNVAASFSFNANSITRAGIWNGITLAGSTFFQTIGGAQVFYTYSAAQPFIWLGTPSNPLIWMILAGSGNLLVGTTDDDGTPATGRLVVQGAYTDSTYNIFVGRNSNGANVTTLDCAGYLVLSGGLRADTGYGFGAAPTAGVGMYAYSASSIELIRGKVGADAPGAIHWTADQCFTFVDGSGPYTQASFNLATGIFSIYTGLTLGYDQVAGSNNTPGVLKFISAGNNAFFTTFTVGTQSADATYTLPLAMPASSGYVLACTNAGVMSWAAAPTAVSMTVAAEATDQTCYPLFVTGATGDLAPKTHAAFGFDALNCYLGIGTPTPSYPLHVAKSWTNAYGSTAKITNVSNLTTNGSFYNTALEIDATGTSITGGVADGGYKTGLLISSYATGYAFAGTLAGMLGFRSLVGIGADATSGAAITNAYGAQVLCYNQSAGTTITNSYGIYIDSRNSAIGTITNAWDIYAASATAYNYFAGRVGIGISTPSAAKLHILKATADYLLPAILISGKSIYGTGDDADGFTYTLVYNLTGNRQLVLSDTEYKYGVRFVGSTIDGFDLNATDRRFLHLGSDSHGVHIGGANVNNTQCSISNAAGAVTKVVLEIKGATAQSGNYLNITTISDLHPGDILSVTSAGDMFLGTYDVDGTPATGRLVVQGSMNDGTTNIFVGRDSDGANQFVLNTDGQITTGSWHATTLAYDHGGTGLTVYPTRTILLGANSASLGTTTPCTRVTRELATNKQVVDSIVFPVSGVGIAWFNFPIPDAYDSGTFIITVYYYSVTSEAANFRFQAAMSASADAEAMDVALGTTVLVTAACSGTALFQKVATFGAVTASPTPAPGHKMFLKLWRDPDEGSDNSTLDAHVTDIKIEFVASAWTD